MSSADLVGASSGRTQLDLMTAQLEAVDAWHRARRASEAAAIAAAVTRESRLDLSRRMDARRREQEALLRRAEQQLRESGRRRLGVDEYVQQAYVMAEFEELSSADTDADGLRLPSTIACLSLALEYNLSPTNSYKPFIFFLQLA